MPAGKRNRISGEFGGLPKDDNHIAVQAANYFLTQDATATPQVSPLAYTGTTVYTLVAPQGAIGLILFPSTDLRVSELVGMAQYDIVPAGTKELFYIANMSNIYVKRDSADGSLRFRFIFV